MDLLWAALDTADAWRLLRDPEAGGLLDAEGVLDTARRAGYPEAECQKAATRRANDRLRRSLEP